MPGDIAKLAHEILKNPEKVEIAPQGRTVEKIDQSVYFVNAATKRALLQPPAGRRRARARASSSPAPSTAPTASPRRWRRRGVVAEAIHGNKSQNARQRALDDFSRGQARVLVATDIAARGIDVDGVTHVINYELPDEAESYVHRIGRTARAGASGIALSFCDGEERGQLKSIERLTNQRIAVLPIPANEDMPAAPAAAPSRQPEREERSERRGESRGRGGPRGGHRSEHRGRPRRSRTRGARTAAGPVVATVVSNIIATTLRARRATASGCRATIATSRRARGSRRASIVRHGDRPPVIARTATVPVAIVRMPIVRMPIGRMLIARMRIARRRIARTAIARRDRTARPQWRKRRFGGRGRAA